MDQHKACIRCGESKPIDMFHKHKGMKEGRLNKCAKCVVECVSEWRKKQAEGHRHREYVRDLENGTKTRVRSLDQVRADHDPNGRRKIGLRYAHKRRIRTSRDFDELTQFAFSEAVDLCQMRNKSVGGKWTIDHIVPIHHKLASGLHVAANFQVVPDRWNYKKGNRNMNIFFCY